ncbi:MAG: hypothetical protein CMH97_12685 [Oceanospirillaceae bacterium]|nr:hypothetical protein [Oceanospirillaceae bacterium]
MFVVFQGHAGCYGNDSLKTCYDDSGNSYTVSKFGNQTTVQGTNSRTGSAWSSQSTTIGNTTYQTGTAADGGQWNQTIQTFGDTQYRSGTDSDGNYFNKTCNQFGCN